MALHLAAGLLFSMASGASRLDSALTLIDFAPIGRVYAVRMHSIRTECSSIEDIIAVMLTKRLTRGPQELLLRLAAHRARSGCTTLYAACTIALSRLQFDAMIRFLGPCANLELEGSDLGWVSIGACANRRLLAVRLLVLKRAQVFHTNESHTIIDPHPAKNTPKTHEGLKFSYQSRSSSKGS